MFRRTVIALSVAGLLAGTGIAALAQDAPRPAHAHGMAHMQKRLGLTDDQANAVRTAFANHREEQKQAWLALHTAQMELRQMALDGADTTAKAAEVQQLMAQSIALRVKVLQEIGPVLTPEQRAKFAQASFHGGKRHQRRPPAVQS